jgi:hypothetical protein
MSKTKDVEFFSEENRAKIRKAYRARKRVIELDGRKFNIEKAPGRAGAPFILVKPVDGMTPIGQVEIERFGSSKLKDDKGNRLLGISKKGS